MSHREGDARPPVLAIHLAGLIAVPGCLAAGALELTRALGGNQLSWTYAVEWPMIGGFVVYVWIRLVRERRPADPRPASRAPQIPTPTDRDDTSDDPGLRAWQEYLARLRAQDPPGGPPR